MKKLELIQMQELLVDYVLNRISDEDKLIFEAHLQYFPEIEAEMLEAKKLFLRIENTDFDKITSQRTRNTTYKVRQRYSPRQLRSEKKFKFMTKIVLPTIGLAAVILLMFISVDFTTFFKDKQSDYSLIKNDFFENVDLESYEDISDVEIPYINNNLNTNSDLIIDSLFIEYAVDFILEEYDFPLYYIQNNSIEQRIYDKMIFLDEDDFQHIYEEMKNADFNI